MRSMKRLRFTPNFPSDLAMKKLVLSAALASDVLEIARVAGAATMTIFEKMNNGSADSQASLVSYKTDNSPVTQADLLAHQVISERLNVLTPRIPVVSEEDEQSLKYRLPQGDFWLVDPLDGTKEFLAHSREFTVNIALIRDGRAVFGVVVAPALEQAYWGGRGLGAFCDFDGQSKPIHIANAVQARLPLRVIASKSHMNPETAAFIGQLGACELLQAGSSLKFCRVAEGAADIYPRLGPTCEWDTAAAQAIVEAAGGYVLMLDGSPLTYGKPEILNPHFVVLNVPLFELRMVLSPDRIHTEK